jgi:hypothetical protein
MKLSEAVDLDQYNKDNQYELVNKIEQLESDSQMLEDLIEMMSKLGCIELSIDSEGEYYDFKEWHIDYQTYKQTKTTILGRGFKPREAIVDAIKQYKNAI